MEKNKGFDQATIAEYRNRMQASGQVFLPDVEDERTDEYAHFYFIGNFNGREAIYDAALYTLRLQHESELFEIAEQRAVKQFPAYKGMPYDDDEHAGPEMSPELEEEVGVFMAEVILELEEEESVKVKEHIETDTDGDFGVGLDAGLNVEKITDQVIGDFIRDFNAGTLALDPTLYTFQTSQTDTEPE